MNDDLFMNGGPGFSLLTTITLLMPILAMAYKRKMWNNSFLALAACFILLFFSSLISMGAIETSENLKYTFNTLSTFFQAPLILLFLSYFAQHEQMKKTMKLSVVFLLTTGILILTRKDIQEAAIPVVLGLGFILVIIFSILFFIYQVKASVHQRAETGKTFIISGILFAYFCYSFIFTVNVILRSNNTQDLFTLFEISIFISTFLIVLGILLNKPIPVEKPIEKPGKEPRLTEWEEFTSFN